MHPRAVTAFILILLATTFAQAQQLVVNGSFDVNATGWNIQNGSSSGFQPDKGNPGGFFVLDQATPSPTDDPTLSQLVRGLVPGAVYLVSGDYELSIDRGGGTPGAASFGVALDNVFFFWTPTPHDFDWHGFDFTFTASASNVCLILASQLNNTGASYGVDNLSIVPVPEPATLSLLLAGIVVLLCIKSSSVRSNHPSYDR